MREQFDYHAGERAVQARAGEEAIALRNGTVIGNSVIAGARLFIEKQFMVVISSADPAGRIWSSLLFGRPGFVSTHDDGSAIAISAAQHERDLTDPLWHNIQYEARVGLLFIEMSTRRRYRVNGRVTSNGPDGLMVNIDEAYPNCPKFIQRRHLRQMPPRKPGNPSLSGTIPTRLLVSIIRAADTMFVASAHAERGLDASHRGGKAGFIAILDDGTLRIPDYQGNSMFNTLGNIASNPNTGLMVPDFAGNRLLHLSGCAFIRWDMDDEAGVTGGTRRFLDFKVDHWVLRDAPYALDWEYLDASPFNPPLG